MYEVFLRQLFVRYVGPTRNGKKNSGLSGLNPATLPGMGFRTPTKLPLLVYVNFTTNIFTDKFLIAHRFIRRNVTSITF